MKKISLFCSATAFAIANLFYGNLNPTTSQDLTLENIDAVGSLLLKHIVMQATIKIVK